MQIRINGEEYDSWDDVPEELRRALAQVMPDRDHDGVPDDVEPGAPPGHRTYRRRYAVTMRTEKTQVPASGDRPAFRFQIDDPFVRELPPDLDDLGEDPVETPRSTAPAGGPILLNGVEVGPDGRPLRKKRWWGKG